MTTSITAEEIYSRQVTLLGKEKQEKIRSSSILVVGAGGLGCPALQYLTSSGVGRIGIVDHDHVTISNLQRQILFKASDLGKRKVAVAAHRLKDLGPFTNFHEECVPVNDENVLELISPYDVILDCTDNFQTKFLLHDAAFLTKKILVQASVYQYEGQLHVFNFQEQEGPCLRCLWPEEPQDGCTGTCAEVGVMGPLLGVLGSLQAMEALKAVTGMSPSNNGESVFVDLLGLSIEKRKFKRRIGCVLCEKRKFTLQKSLGIEMPEDLTSFQIIDVRSSSEHRACKFLDSLFAHSSVTNIPLPEFEDFIPQENIKYLLVCERGLRSLTAARMLKKKHPEVFSLRGGVSAYDNT